MDKKGAKATLGILSGVSAPTIDYPNKLTAGFFPALESDKGPSTGVEERGARRLHLLPAGSREVLWVVPYAGDTYGGRGANDCSCGDPWNFSIIFSSFELDPYPEGLGDERVRFEVVLHNRTGASFGYGEKATLKDGENKRLLVGKKHGAGLKVDLLKHWKGDQRLLAEGGQTSPGRFSFACFIPQPEPGLFYGDRPWQVRCEGIRNGKVSTYTKKAPAVLRRAHFEESGRWYARDLDMWVAGQLEERMNEGGPRGYSDWPLFEGGAVQAMEPASVKVSTTSELSSESGRYTAAKLIDQSADTAWCTKAKKGEAVTFELESPVKLKALALLPGMVSTDWLYHANAAPQRLRVVVGDKEIVWELPSLASANLMREGMRALLLELPSEPVNKLTLAVEALRPGRYYEDLCISEVLLLKERPIAK